MKASFAHIFESFCLIGILVLVGGCSKDDDPVKPGTSTQKLVYVSDEDGNFEIYIANTDGSGKTRLTNNSAEDYCPRINASKSRIAFVSKRSDSYEVYTMGMDGKNVTQVTTGGTLGGQYGTSGGVADWMPDGRILFTRSDKLMRCNSDGSQESVLYTAPQGRNLSGVRCSPNGDRIAVFTQGPWAYDSELYVLNADGSSPTLIVNDEPGAMHLGAFLPDGSRIAYMYDVSGHEETSGRQLDTHIFTITLDGNGKTDLSAGKAQGSLDYAPAYTQDLKKIVFMNMSSVPGSTPALWEMNPDGSGRKLLVPKGSDPNIR
ncbi:MAG: PD40 domain-containing protein [Ignavibacteriae bacterium]|nr:PD40 domain-containing protein [Ignavibacteriota bacterium]